MAALTLVPEPDLETWLKWIDDQPTFLNRPPNSNNPETRREAFRVIEAFNQGSKGE